MRLKGQGSKLEDQRVRVGCVWGQGKKALHQLESLGSALSFPGEANPSHQEF